MISSIFAHYKQDNNKRKENKTMNVMIIQNDDK